MPKATANGKTFNFPEGTTPEQMGAAIDEYFGAEPVAATDPAQQDSFLDDTLDVAGEAAAFFNSEVADMADFLIGLTPLGRDMQSPTSGISSARSASAGMVWTRPVT